MRRRARSARKRFGQHFLHDRTVVQRIVDAIAPQPEDLLVEIGPGGGALTYPLLRSGCTLHVVEIDRDLSASLREQQPRYPNLTIHEGDALKFDLSSLAAPPRRLRVTGNLPYNISTPFVFRLLAMLPRIVDMHLMLQKEVVDRMVAEPNHSAYGRLSVMVQLDCEVHRVLRVSAGAFSPPPRIESALVRLCPHPRATLDPATRDRLAAIVGGCFSKRRKILRNALRGICDTSTLAAAGIDPQVRPETLTVEEFIDLARVSADHTADPRTNL